MMMGKGVTRGKTLIGNLFLLKRLRCRKVTAIPKVTFMSLSICILSKSL